MRKSIYSLVVAIYFLLSSGFVVQLHYCMDRLQEIGLFSDRHDGACEDCGMDMNADNGCCQDRTEVIKLVQDQSVQQDYAPSFKNIADLSGVFTAQTAEADWQIRTDRSFSIRNHSSGLDRYRYRLLSVYRI